VKFSFEQILKDGPVVMAILNLTPDSFYKGSRVEPKELLDICASHIDDGATILDLGGYSTRPGAKEVSVQDEINRIVPAIEVVKREFPNISVSVDTFRSKVAKAAINAGADIVNDVSGGTIDSEMLSFIKSAKVSYVFMHMRGTPQTMQSKAVYDDVVSDVLNEVSSTVLDLKTSGVDVVFDPGFGFAKTLDQNYSVLKQIERFKELNCPILVGVSRKSMIYKYLDIEPTEALNGTSVLNTVALMNGAQVLRVHDAKPAKEVIELIKKLNLS